MLSDLPESVHMEAHDRHCSKSLVWSITSGPAKFPGLGRPHVRHEDDGVLVRSAGELQLHRLLHHHVRRHPAHHRPLLQHQHLHRRRAEQDQGRSPRGSWRLGRSRELGDEPERPVRWVISGGNLGITLQSE